MAHRNEAAGDFVAGGLGFGLANKATRPIAPEFGQLVAEDGSVIVGPARSSIGARQDRSADGQDDACRKCRKNKEIQHVLWSSSGRLDISAPGSRKGPSHCRMAAMGRRKPVEPPIPF